LQSISASIEESLPEKTASWQVFDPKPEFDSQGKFCHAPTVNFYQQQTSMRARRVAEYF
jgi:hypothetical protein